MQKETGKSEEKMMRQPDFIGIGVMKAATTWLWYQLHAHPQISMLPQKELHYFDLLNITPQQYLEKFSKVPKKFLTGEVTPSYIQVPHAPIIAKKLCPKTKFLVLLRNPVDRAWSHWKVAKWAEGKIPLETSFVEAFNMGHPWGPQWNTIKERGCYLKYLKNWYKEFPKEQIKIMWHDDVEKNPVGLLKDLYAWLGVEDSFVPKEYNKKINENWSGRKPILKPEDREKIVRYYLPAIERLEKFTGRNLAAWKK